MLYGKYIKGENNEDLSPHLFDPKYYPEIHFILTNAPVPHESKNFGKLR